MMMYRGLMIYYVSMFIIIIIMMIMMVEGLDIEVNLGRIKSIERIWNQDTHIKLFNSTNPMLCSTNVITGSRPNTFIVICNIENFTSNYKNGDAVELFATLYSLKTNWIYATVDISYVAYLNPPATKFPKMEGLLRAAGSVVAKLRSEPKLLSTLSLSGATAICTVGTIRSLSEYLRLGRLSRLAQSTRSIDFNAGEINALEPRSNNIIDALDQSCASNNLIDVVSVQAKHERMNDTVIEINGESDDHNDDDNDYFGSNGFGRRFLNRYPATFGSWRRFANRQFKIGRRELENFVSRNKEQMQLKIHTLASWAKRKSSASQQWANGFWKENQLPESALQRAVIGVSAIAAGAFISSVVTSLGTQNGLQQESETISTRSNPQSKLLFGGRSAYSSKLSF